MISLKRKIYNLFHPKVGEIWCLHRVLPERSVFKSNRDLEMTPEYLEWLIHEKQHEGFRFVDMETFVAAAIGERREEKLVHVTFDDGFVDVFIHAYPILKRLQIPFTLYVTTDMPDGKADLWWYQLEQMAKDDVDWFEKTIQQIYTCQKPVAAAMHDVTASAVDMDLCQRLSLSWDQIRTMMAEGLCAVGSHGVSHAGLTQLSEEQAHYELSESKRRLEEMLGTEIRHFSYPHSFYSEATNQMVWKAGYDTAVIGYGGMTRRKKEIRFYYRNFVVQP